MVERSRSPQLARLEALLKQAAAIEEKYLLRLVDEYGTGVLTMPVSRQHCSKVAALFVEILELAGDNKSFRTRLLATLLYNTDRVRAALNARALHQAKHPRR